MKEASGELSMTLIVIIAAGVILAIFLAFRPAITNSISKMWSNFGTQGDKAQTETTQQTIDGFNGKSVN